MKAKARRLYPDWPEAYKIAEHLKQCSCSMCCNVRRSRLYGGLAKLTLQERRLHDEAATQERDFEEQSQTG